MNLTREETIRALDVCNDMEEACEHCPLHDVQCCKDILKRNYSEYIKNEPAPSANDTSSKENIIQVKDTTAAEICQAPEYETAQEYSNFMLELIKSSFGQADVGTLIASKDYCSVDFKFNGRECGLSFRMEPRNADQN